MSDRLLTLFYIHVKWSENAVLITPNLINPMYKHMLSQYVCLHFIEHSQNGFMPGNKHLCHKTLNTMHP